MSTPPLLLGVTLIFWGWQAELLAIAVIAAVLLEGSRLVGWRWAFTEQDFSRVWSVCIYVFVGMTAYLVVMTDLQGAARATLTLFQWYPLSVLAILLAQVYSTAGSVELSVLSTISRKRKSRDAYPEHNAIDLSYPYFSICLLSASTAHEKSSVFYIGLCLLVAWALWSIRPKVCSSLAWMTIFAMVVGMGYAGHVGLQHLQQKLEGTLTDWFLSMTGDHVDPDRSYTAIGSLGEIKLSNQIVLRMVPDAKAHLPVLLRQASYNRYLETQWFARSAGFRPVTAGLEDGAWQLESRVHANVMTTISIALDGGEGILSLAPRAVQIQTLPVGSVQGNALGAIKVEDGPGLVSYRVGSAENSVRDAPPDDADVHVPEAEAEVLDRIVGELGLSSEAPRESFRTLAGHFERNFQYSRFLGEHRSNTTPLSEFLQSSRSGHCEYFATATVLLLRAAGIPARYAVGHSVHEFSSLEGQYIARARDAHSWALVYVDGVWRDFDTTPASWVAIEQDAAPWWEAVSDVWQWVTFTFAEWKWGDRDDDLTTYMAWLLLPLVLFLAWRLYTAKRVTSGNADGEQPESSLLWPGRDSEWYEIEHRLNALGIVRHPWEPFSQWVKRIRETQTGSLIADSLDAILALHYRYRFDPNGITEAERAALTSYAGAWLKQGLVREQPV